MKVTTSDLMNMGDFDLEMERETLEVSQHEVDIREVTKDNYLSVRADFIDPDGLNTSYINPKIVSVAFEEVLLDVKASYTGHSADNDVMYGYSILYMEAFYSELDGLQQGSELFVTIELNQIYVKPKYRNGVFSRLLLIASIKQHLIYLSELIEAMPEIDQVKVVVQADLESSGGEAMSEFACTFIGEYLITGMLSDINFSCELESGY